MRRNGENLAAKAKSAFSVKFAKSHELPFLETFLSLQPVRIEHSNFGHAIISAIYTCL